MTDIGFKDVGFWRLMPNYNWIRSCTDCHALVWEEIASKLPNESDKKKEFIQVIKDLGEGTRKGAVFGVAKLICIGRASACT